MRVGLSARYHLIFRPSHQFTIGQELLIFSGRHVTLGVVNLIVAYEFKH